MLLLEQDIIKKGQVHKLTKLKSKQEIDIRDDKEYKVKAICDSKIYVKETAGQLFRLYYLISWKSYTKEKST